MLDLHEVKVEASGRLHVLVPTIREIDLRSRTWSVKVLRKASGDGGVILGRVAEGFEGQALAQAGAAPPLPKAAATAA